jgi:hypothetical protein
MFWIPIAAVLLVVLIAPIRNAFFGAWRFMLPAIGGLVGGLLFTSFLVGFGVPAWAMLVLPPLLAFSCGAAGKAWLDQNFGPPKQNP